MTSTITASKFEGCTTHMPRGLRTRQVAAVIDVEAATEAVPSSGGRDEGTAPRRGGTPAAAPRCD